MRHSSRTRFVHALLILTCLTLSSFAQASVGQAYGYGSRTAALGGAGAAYGFDGYAGYDNPGGIPFTGEKRLIASGGLLFMSPSFKSIQDVIVENAYTSDKQVPGDVDTSYRDVFGAVLGLSYRIFPNAYNLSVGVTVFTPFEQLAYMDTGEAFIPEYVLYRSRNQSPQVNVGMGADLGHGFQVGGGIYNAFSLTSSGTVFLQTDSSKPSTMRFSASMKPKFAPQFGVLYLPKNPESPNAEPALTAGVVVRLAASSPNSLYLTSGARAFGSFAALDFNFNAVSTLLYNPLSVETGVTIKEGDSNRTYLQLDYQAWGDFQPPALDIQNPQNPSCNDASCGVKLSPGKNPIFSYKNIFIPRVGQEIRLTDRATVRLGYAYQPSIIEAVDGKVAPGAGNYLDPSKHSWTIGAGYTFQHFLNFDIPCTVDAHFALQRLVTQHIVKDPGDETGDTSGGKLKIGASNPNNADIDGYDAGGNIWGGGVSLSLGF